MGHWLQGYQTGFLPRGLPGATLAPLFFLKTPEEVRFALTVLALLSLSMMLLALTRLLSALFEIRGPMRTTSILLAFAVVTSAWNVLNGLIVGYYDHLVDLAVIGAAASVGTRFRRLAPVLLCAAALTHELTLFALPTVAALTWVLNRERRVRELLWLLVPVGLVALALGAAARAITPQQIGAVAQGIRATGLFEAGQLEPMVAHLRAHHAGRYFAVARTALPSLLRGDIALLTFPLAGVLLAAAWAWVGRQGWLLVLAAGAPLTLHLVASDTARISYYVVFLSAVLLARVARERPPESVWLSRGLTAGAAGALLMNLTLEVPLMARAKDSEGPLWPRLGPAANEANVQTPLRHTRGTRRRGED